MDHSNGINGSSGTDGMDKSSGGEKYEAQQVERADYVAPRRNKVKNHCARFWWLHLLIFCISFLIIALCLTYVAMPKIAQKGVSESSIEFLALKFMNPTPNSILLTQDAVLHSPSIYTPTLDPFNASLYLVTNGKFASEPITYIPMPRIHVVHPQIGANLTQTVPIYNVDSITNYAISVLGLKNVTTALTGRTKLHEGKLPVIDINYNSTSTYPGLNSLTGFNVTGVKINLTAKAGEPNLSGFAYIPNPSIISIELGNVTLSLSTASAGVIGNSTIENMTLVPGNNTLPMTGIVDQGKIVSSTNSTTGMVTLEIVGQSAVYNGQHLPYYEGALAANKLSLPMNVAAILANSA